MDIYYTVSFEVPSTSFRVVNSLTRPEPEKKRPASAMMAKGIVTATWTISEETLVHMSGQI
jgi:hypothetical protein